MTMPNTSNDLRSKGFTTRTPIADVLTRLFDAVSPLPAEEVPTLQAAGRVLAKSVVSPVDVPAFPRAAMDGFALHATDTDPPLPLTVIGESMPARPFPGTVLPGQAVRITTGAPVPGGADAVLMLELAQVLPNGEVSPRGAVASGKHVIRIGEDVQKNREVLPSGRRLRPQDVGLLASIGVPTVQVHRLPRVALLVTGNELLPPGSVPEGFHIVDSNSPMLTALTIRDGGLPISARYLRDEYTEVHEAIRDAEADVLLVSGGTSVGSEDHAPRVLQELGELAFHGLALRPAAPTGIGFLRGGAVPVFLLPGNPVSCLCAYDLFAGRVVRRLGGRAWELPYRRLTVSLGGPIASVSGRLDYVRVKLDQGQAVPLAAGASNLSSTVAADGFILVPAEREGLASGECVEMWLYDD
jgi:molybdopterin molybdotransferase